MKLLQNFKLNNLVKNIETVIKRFPTWIIILMIIVLLFLYLSHFEYNELEYEIYSNEKIWKVISTLIITFLLNIWITVFIESNSIKALNKIIWSILSIIFWIFFYFYFWPNISSLENLTFFIITFIWISSLLFIAPYLKNIFSWKDDNSKFYTYFYKIFQVFTNSFILWLVLFILWNIAIWSVFELFDLSNFEILDKIISYWAILWLVIITPLYALLQIPNKKEAKSEHFNENIFFSFLIKYIAIRFIYVYFLILYAYTIKVLLNFWDWPKWEVSWMVIWFSLFWYITYIFSYIFEKKSNAIRFFRKYFPYVVIPQIFMLFYAIYLRINQYDLTINRYFIVIFAIFLLTISIYYIFSKNKNLKIIPAVLTLFTIFISVWPWSVYSLPEKRQAKLLINNLEKANILQTSWKITPLDNYKDINNELSNNIYSQIKYLCDFNDCEKVKTIFSEKIKELELENKKQWQEKISKYIKVERSYTWKEDKNFTIHFYLDRQDWQKVFPIKINWYSKIYRLDSYKNSEKQSAFLDIKNRKILLTHNWENLEISTESIFNSLLKNKNTSKNNRFSKKDLTFIWENYKIFFESISLRNDNFTWDEENIYENWSWYILIK